MEKKVDWYAALLDAVESPTAVREAHLHFRKYSLCNRWLARAQMRAQNVPLGPINTYKGWKEAGRQVIAGQKAAIAMVMPVVIKQKTEESDGSVTEKPVQIFLLRNNWFHLGQTEGEPLATPEINEADWALEIVTDTLELKEIPYVFKDVDAEAPGYAMGMEFSINPLDSAPVVSKLTQIARILLGHVNPDFARKDTPEDPTIQKVEAAVTAYLVAASVGLKGLEYLAGDIQSGLAALGESAIQAKVAKRAFGAADKIINAGAC